MPVVYEDFVRCTSCNGADFIEEKTITVPKILKPRENKSLPLEGVEVEIQYKCSSCGTAIDR